MRKLVLMAALLAAPLLWTPSEAKAWGWCAPRTAAYGYYVRPRVYGYVARPRVYAYYAAPRRVYRYRPRVYGALFYGPRVYGWTGRWGWGWGRRGWRW